MKLAGIKINSSVVGFNLLALITMALASLGVWLTDNQAALQDIFSTEQVMGAIAIVNIINLILRTTNITGKKPIEKVDKNRRL